MLKQDFSASDGSKNMGCQMRQKASTMRISLFHEEGILYNIYDPICYIGGPICHIGGPICHIGGPI